MLGHLVSNGATPSRHTPAPGWLKRLLAFIFRRA